MFKNASAVLNKIKSDIDKAIYASTVILFLIMITVKAVSLYNAIKNLAILQIVSSALLLAALTCYFLVWIFTNRKKDKKSKKIKRKVKKYYKKMKKGDKLLRLILGVSAVVLNFTSESLSSALMLLIIFAIWCAIKLVGAYIKNQMEALKDALKADFKEPFATVGSNIKKFFAKKDKDADEQNAFFSEADLAEFDKLHSEDNDQSDDVMIIV